MRDIRPLHIQNVGYLNLESRETCYHVIFIILAKLILLI